MARIAPSTTSFLLCQRGFLSSKNLVVVVALVLCLLSYQPLGALAWSAIRRNVATTQRTTTTRTRILATRDATSTTDHSTQITLATAFSTLVDGPSWSSLKAVVPDILPEEQQQNRQRRTPAVGHLRVVTGTLCGEDTNTKGVDEQRVVGIPSMHSDDKDDLQRLASDSVATIPRDMTDAQAATTYAYCLTHIYPLLHVVQNVGGSGSSSTEDGMIAPPRHAVIVGGNDDAVQAARGLAALGSERVTIVSTQNPKVPPVNNNKDNLVQVTNPSMASDDDDDDDKDELGFSEALGQFDALLDTLGNERDEAMASTETSVMRLLRERHGCETYVSACTQAHELLGKEGVFWGPGKVKDYTQGLVQPNVLSNIPLLSAPVGLGQTVQTLLQAKIVWPQVPKEHKQAGQSASVHVRGWDMARFMETTLWPMDNRGTASTRFGFPVVGGDSDRDDEDEEMVLELPSIRDRTELREEEEAGDVPAGEEHVRRIAGPRGLQRRIVDGELDCVLFLSAKFCRTCKRMQLQYRRMARLNSQFTDEELIFAKGEVSGLEGKMLGRALGVETVPTFVLFRKGQRFGEPLSISRLPSASLERAIDYLKEGKEWDDSILQNDKNDKDNTGNRFKL